MPAKPSLNGSSESEPDLNSPLPPPKAAKTTGKAAKFSKSASWTLETDDDRTLIQAIDAALASGSYSGFGELCRTALTAWLLEEEPSEDDPQTETLPTGGVAIASGETVQEVALADQLAVAIADRLQSSLEARLDKRLSEIQWQLETLAASGGTAALDLSGDRAPWQPHRVSDHPQDPTDHQSPPTPPAADDATAATTRSIPPVVRPLSLPREADDPAIDRLMALLDRF